MEICKQTSIGNEVRIIFIIALELDLVLHSGVQGTYITLHPSISPHNNTVR